MSRHDPSHFQDASHDVNAPSEPRAYNCPYCGASLDLRYAFCIHCARPYREEIHLDEEIQEFEPSLETRIQNEGRLAINFFLVLFAGATLLGSITELPNINWAICLQTILVAVVTLGFAIYERRQIAPLFRNFKPHWSVLASLPMLTGFLLLNRAYHEFALRAFGVEPAVDILKGFQEAVPFPVVVLTLCVFPGVFEELGFRGFVQERLVKIAGFGVGVLFTSLLFVILHFSLVSAPYLFLLSLFFCWVRDRTGSIYPTIVLHFLHNFAVLFLFQES